jgi:hypothetical protein
MEAYKNYSDQVMQMTPVILNLKLRPFSLGHATILKQAKSIFVVGSDKNLKYTSQKELTDNFAFLFYELVFACLVCSTTYDEVMEEFQNGAFATYLHGYAQGLMESLKKAKKWNLFTELQQFRHYVKAGTTPPYCIPTRQSDDVVNNPIAIEHTIKNVLMSECNYTREDVLNLPYNETLADFILFAYKQDKCEIVSKEEYELMERLKKEKHEREKACPA